MASSNNSSSGGIGFAGLLFIVFLVLKLTHVIDWSWWWVTAPLWGIFALVLLIMLIGGVIWGLGMALYGIFTGLAGVLSKKAKKKRHMQMPENAKARLSPPRR